MSDYSTDIIDAGKNAGIKAATKLKKNGELPFLKKMGCGADQLGASLYAVFFHGAKFKQAMKDYETSFDEGVQTGINR